MPTYARARQDYAIPVINVSSVSRHPNDRLQPFREPNLNTAAATTGPRRQNRLSTDHQPSPITPAVTGIAYPTEEDDDLEFDEPVHNSSRHPVTIDQNHSYRDGHSNSRSNYHHHITGNGHNHSMPAYQTNAQAGNNSSSLDDNSSDNLGGMASAGETPLDKIWDAIREKKARKMAKERPKVESLEEITGELATSDYPLHLRHHPHPQGGYAHSYQQPSASQILDNVETMSVPMPIAQDHMQPAPESLTKQVKKRKSLYVVSQSQPLDNY